MPRFAIERIKRRAAMPGLFVVNRRTTMREIINELLMLDGCSDMSEWEGQIVLLPL